MGDKITARETVKKRGCPWCQAPSAACDDEGLAAAAKRLVSRS